MYISESFDAFGVLQVRVLLIDDDPDDRRLAARILDQVLQAPEIVEIGDSHALETAFRHPVAPGLVVTDYVLGWTDGFDVFQRVRAAHPTCPVLVFTGVGDEALAVRLIKAGIDDYIVKSDLRQLGTAAREAIERAAERQRLEEAEIRYRDLFRSMPVGLHQCKPDGRLVAGNPALVALLGLGSEDDLHGVDLNAHVAAGTPFPPREAGEEPWTAELRLRRADGSLVRAIHVVWAIRDEGAAGFRGALVDIGTLEISPHD